MKTLIRNVTMVNEGLSFLGSLLIDGEKIGMILSPDDNGEYGADSIIDGTDLILMPGVIDDQVHFRQPGGEQKADIASESAAAVLGGVTSYMDMPNNTPAATTIETLEAKYSIASKDSAANYSFYLGATNDNIDQVRRVDPSKICGIKVFMGSSTGNMLVDNDEALEQIFREAPTLIATHCEDEGTIRANLEAAKAKYEGSEGGIPFSEHPLIRSREACIASTTKAIDLAVKYGSRLHVLHVSTADELSLLRNYKKKGSLISSEVCVHYLWFDDSQYGEYGSHIKCNPAIKGISDRDAIRTAVREGAVGAVATDHAPHLLSEKDREYINSPSGLPLIQHSLQMMLQLSEQGLFPITQVVKMMCHAPAECFKIKRRGYLREGYYADLVLVKKIPYTVSKDNIAYKCGWSPLEGTTFDYTISDTFVNGTHVVSDGLLTEEKKSGMRLRFNR